MITSQADLPIALIYALKEEVKLLLKSFKFKDQLSTCRFQLLRGNLEGVPMVLCRTGVGMPNAHEGTEFLLNNVQPSVVFSLGFAGACHPELKTGDLILVNEIRSETPQDHFYPDTIWGKNLEEAIQSTGLVYREGILLTAWKLAGQNGKEKWGKEGVSAIDMETAAIAAVVRKAKIPFLSLRAIFDPLEESLPFTDPMPKEINPTLFVLKNPKMILKIPKYMRMNQICQKNLAMVVKSIVLQTRVPQSPIEDTMSACRKGLKNLGSVVPPEKGGEFHD